MKHVITLILLFATILVQAQDDDCDDRRLAKNGGWGKPSVTNYASAADYAIQKRFNDAAHAVFGRYVPRGTQPYATFSFASARDGEPLAMYHYSVMGMYYACRGEGLELEGETYNHLELSFNSFGHFYFFNPYTGDDGPGFDVLREGLPKEILPGVWQFAEEQSNTNYANREAKMQGVRKLYLFTYPGQLPWQPVTRREFLEKRRRIISRQKDETQKQMQENLQRLEEEKKEKEKEYAGDAKKMTNYLNAYYNPALADAREKSPKLLAAYDASLERINEQLKAPANELDGAAIVLKSTSSLLDYSFVSAETPGAAILIKPRLAYFKKGLPASAPQVITLDINFRGADPVSNDFAQQMESIADLDYLQSLVGKTAPAAFTGKGNAPSSAPGAASRAPATPAAAAQKTPSQTRSANANTSINPPASPGVASTNSRSNEGSTRPGTKTYTLSGTLAAPAGVAVTLANNGANDLTITTPKTAGNLYTTTPFKFNKPLNENEPYSVTLKKMPSNMTGVVYGGSGKAPGGTENVRVGVDYTYELVSRDSKDVFSGFYESSDPAVGGMGAQEGRYVAFVSWTSGFAGNDGKYRQIFWRDRNTGITRMVSTSPDGAPGNETSGMPSLSADGQTVVFESMASNLVPGDNNNVRDIFLWRAQTGKIERLSIAQNGGWSDGHSYAASISGNGQYVVFTSDAANLTDIPKGRSQSNVFLRSIAGGTTEMISIDPVANTGADGHKASISFDGSRVSFCSPSPTLVANDNNNLWDIFLWEKGKKGLRRLSLTQDGKERNQGQESASRQVASVLSGNGRFVVYATTANNMVPGDNLDYQDVFVYDIENNQLQVASFTEEGRPGNNDSPIDQGDKLAISYDGTWVAFPTKTSNLGVRDMNIVLFNTQNRAKRAVTNTEGSSYVGRPAISYSGSYVVFGKGEKMDLRQAAAFGGSGIFAHFTGLGPCRDCKE